MIGASYLINGNYIIARRDMTVACKLVEVESGKILASEQVTDRSNRILRIKDALSRSVADALKKSLPQLAVPAPKAEAPEVPLERVAEYGQAHDYGDRGGYEKARALLKSLSAQAPSFSYPAAELAALEKRIAGYDRERRAKNILSAGPSRCYISVGGSEAAPCLYRTPRRYA